MNSKKSNKNGRRSKLYLKNMLMIYGKITKFIDNTSEIANLNALFLNTIYFKGGWISSFLKESTQNKHMHCN